MPSQDLLFPILPRAPATPGSEEIKREVNQISKKHQLRKTSTDNSDSQQREQAYSQKKNDQQKVEDSDHKPDPDHQIDLFV
ncbi:hypothetical protein LA366_06130 [Aeromonas jandaei]|uniref:Uncharacterized protein n=1 Tax=Aeromonas jandaei TaxID=650 RepID=A0A7T4A9W6_AERJA|nr:hypothetical protein [Aeromonas jandaei]MBW3761318.1 hypothetical protein [Aeromonas jandaei]QQB19968.1 hypothetical protein I6H43_21210 [Aeromonas jandaei]UCA34657.1 hypothetical protein LA366_06130 [Aeromonas jandaei]